MNEKINITSKLLEMVKKRKTPLIIDKHGKTYERPRRTGRSSINEGYSNYDED